MINNKLKKKVREKNLQIFWITNPNVINIEIAVDTNYFDIFVIDYEHSLILTQEIISTILFLNSRNVPVFMRFAKFNIKDAPKFLDFGINGIIASDVNSYENFLEIKDLIFYPKIGKRGVGLGRMNNHGDNFNHYLKKINKSLVFLPMIEKNISLIEIEKIFKSNYSDGCLIGPYDLSMSIGSPGNFKNPKFKKIENFIIKMSRKYKKAAGLHFMNKNYKKLPLIKKSGFNFLPILTDVQFFKIGIELIAKK